MTAPVAEPDDARGDTAAPGARSVYCARTARVQLLPPELCNQIAAGEVLERPASAVKELVENALDAGARAVFVDLDEGGQALIRITDDGSGMRREDAELALQRHATSKISTVDDLSAIRTLGFRGEALASIASVSRMRLITQPHDAMLGTLIEIEGGHTARIAETAAAPGTVIEVRDLFYNTPARLKFLKRDTTELKRVQGWMQRLALMRPDVHFRLTADGRKRLDVPPHRDPVDRLLAVLGRELTEALHPLPELPPVDGVVTRGWFSEPSFTVRGGGSQFVFVNGRFIKDRTISAAITAAYRELMGKGRQPAVVLFIEVPLDLIDVNVHPTKIEVRFQDNDTVFRSVYRGLRDGLAAAPWARDTPGRARLGSAIGTLEDDDFVGGGGDRALAERTGTEAGATAREPWLSALLGGAPNDRARRDAPSLYDAAPWVGAERPLRGSSAPDGLRRPDEGLAPRAPQGGPGERSAPYFSRLRYIGQYSRAYLVCSDSAGLVIVDQHAAHERISFERLKASHEGRAPESQRLLFPVQLELDAVRAAALEDHLDFFAELGFELEPFGGQSFALKAVPGMLAGARYLDIVKDALDDLSNLERTTRVEEAIEAVLSRMACHGSVRAGDDLTEEEVYALFEQMDRIDFRAHCPHGRPVYFRLTLEELEKRFDRR